MKLIAFQDILLDVQATASSMHNNRRFASKLNFFRPRVSSNLGLKHLLIFLVQKSGKLCHFSQMSTKFKKEWNTIF